MGGQVMVIPADLMPVQTGLAAVPVSIFTPVSRRHIP